MNGKDDRIQKTEFRIQSLHSGSTFMGKRGFRGCGRFSGFAPGDDNFPLQEQAAGVSFRARRVVGSRTIRPIRSIRVIRVPPLNLDASRRRLL